MTSIRVMEPEDVGAVATVERQSFSPWSPDMISCELEVGKGRQFVAQDSSGCVIGWCCCRVFPPEAELLKIAVDQKLRKRGVGTVLLNHLFNELKNSLVSLLFLEVRAANQTALEFYWKNGFKSVGRRPGYYNDPLDDALVFQKDL